MCGRAYKLQGMGCSKLLAEGAIRHTNFELYKGFLIGIQSYGKVQNKSTKIGLDGDEKHFTFNFIHLFIRFYLGLQHFPPS